MRWSAALQEFDAEHVRFSHRTAVAPIDLVAVEISERWSFVGASCVQVYMGPPKPKRMKTHYYAGRSGTLMGDKAHGKARGRILNCVLNDMTGFHIQDGVGWSSNTYGPGTRKQVTHRTRD